MKLNMIAGVMLAGIFLLNEIIIIYYDLVYVTPSSWEFMDKCPKCEGTFENTTLFFLLGGYMIPPFFVCLGLSVHTFSEYK